MRGFSAQCECMRRFVTLDSKRLQALHNPLTELGKLLVCQLFRKHLVGCDTAVNPVDNLLDYCHHIILGLCDEEGSADLRVTAAFTA